MENEGQVRSLKGSSVLIVGLGDIGREFGWRMKALGCTVTGVKRTPGGCPDYVGPARAHGSNRGRTAKRGYRRAVSAKYAGNPALLRSAAAGADAPGLRAGQRRPGASR